jgi:beta-lactamase regulating signal transducer with metallopeptidase domain
MVALRLICPSLPESQTSLIPDSKPITSVVLAEKGNTANIDMNQSVQLPSDLPQSVTSIQTGQKSVDCGEVLGAVWLTGTVVMTAYGAVSSLLLRRKVAPSIKEDGVWLCDNIASPFILGILRPRIYLPSALESDCRDNVLAHEQAHLRRKDHWWKPLGFVLLSIHWFNPVMWLAYILLCRDIEAACDERVIKGMDVQERKKYSRQHLYYCHYHQEYGVIYQEIEIFRLKEQYSQYKQ